MYKIYEKKTNYVDSLVKFTIPASQALSSLLSTAPSLESILSQIVPNDSTSPGKSLPLLADSGFEFKFHEKVDQDSSFLLHLYHPF
jgi:hypothetical protein